VLQGYSLLLTFNANSQTYLYIYNNAQYVNTYNGFVITKFMYHGYPTLGPVSARRPVYRPLRRGLVCLFTARAVHPLVPDNNFGANYPCGYGQIDEILGPVLGGRQRVHACRYRGRVLLHYNRRRQRGPNPTRGTSQAGGVAGHPLDAVRWQLPVLVRRSWNGNCYKLYYTYYIFIRL